MKEMKKGAKKGFGLLEVLLAGVIIIIILGALVTVAKSSINNSVYLQQRSQATLLAQEGIEVVRQIRDTNYIDDSASTKWDNLVEGAASKPDTTTLNYAVIYPMASGRRLSLAVSNASNNVINVGGTNYSRNIKFSVPDYNEIKKGGDISYNANTLTKYQGYKVTAEVSWQVQGITKTITISEIIANSRQGF